MKSYAGILLILFVFHSFGLRSQTTVLLTADYDVAIGYHDNYNTANTNYWNASQNAAYVLPGTHSLGGLNVNRALIHFDLSVIPSGATVTSARMNLYAIGPPLYSAGHTGTNNSSYLQRVTQPWGAATATWNNQPATTTVNQATLPQSTSPLQNYTNIDVTAIVLDMMSTSNYGFMLRLVNELLTNGLMFSSIDCGIPSQYPTLEITYILNLSSPPIHCMAVDPNGDVTLTWQPADQTVLPFHSYHLWTSSSLSGPFTKFDSIFSHSTLTTTHAGAGANIQPIYYYLTVRHATGGNPISVPTDTVSTIFLQAVNTGGTTGVATLNWNPTHDPLLTTSTGIYKIWKEYPPGHWQMIGTTVANHFTDSVSVCQEYISYRVEIEDTFNTQGSPGQYFCKSGSNIGRDLFEELIPPPPPNIVLVTVDTALQHSVISWEVNPAPDTDGYIIFVYQNGIYTPTDTIYGINNNTYTDPDRLPCTGPLTYALAAFDTCGNLSSFSLHHNTLLPQIQQTHCIPENHVQWNPYINMAPALGGYDLYVSMNGGAPSFIASLPAGSTGYTHSNLSMGSEYCYHIQAFDSQQQKFSQSCIVCQLVAMPEPIDSIYIKTVTVENNRNVRIVLHNDPQLPATAYNLYRSVDGITFQPLTTIAWTNLPSVEFLDQTAIVHASSYYYQAEIIDLCGDPAAISNIAKTILLEAITDHHKALNTITWNDYAGFYGAPSSYYILRQTNGEPDPLPLIISPPSTGLFIDDVSVLPESAGLFSYTIECREGPGNGWGFQEKSLSNEVIIQMEPRIYIPSGFTPDGQIPGNMIFKPIGRFISNNHYEFNVFNRFGQMVFRSEDPNEGWDGTYQGKKVSEGAYVWRLQFEIPSGKIVLRGGTVLLIR